jgi:hypothetical protein
VLAWLGIGQLAISGADALARDGLRRGQRAPRWTLADAAGTMHASPPADRLQLIVFADHSLKSFPSVVAGLRELADGGPPGDLEIVVMTRGASAGARELLGPLGLTGIPVVAGSPATYAAYNVRVMPFAIFVAGDGVVRASSLVNHDWQLAKLRLVAQIPPEADGAAGASGTSGAAGPAVMMAAS